MHTFNSILFASDFSPAAEDALRYAAEFARVFDASLTLCHVAEIPYGFTGQVEEFKEQAMEEGTEHLQERADALKENPDFAGLNIGVVMRLGRITTSVLDEVKEGDYDLLLMSSEGRYEGKPLSGSLLDDIILYSSKPVLVVPPGTTNYNWDRILFATDYNENDLDHLSEVAALAHKAGAMLEVIHVLPEEKDQLHSRAAFLGFEEMARDQIPNDNLSFKLLSGDNFISGFNTYAAAQPGDLSLLVVSRNERGSFRKLFSSGTTTRLPFETEMPVLIMV